MPPELIALIEKPWLLLIVLAVGAALGMAVERGVERSNTKRRKAYWSSRKKGKAQRKVVAMASAKAEPSRVDTAVDHLRLVMGAQFDRRPLFNRGEHRLLTLLDQLIAEQSPGWRLMGQVSLGEILSSADKEAFRAINSKRVDLLVVDRHCMPLHAIELQGSGHHLSTDTAARDAVKKEALRRAGIGYVEVVTGDRPSDVAELVRKLVRASGPESVRPTATH